MNNFPIKVNGKTYWISRSVATVGFIFTTDNGFRVLAIKRGKGSPDEIGKWCCPCGYLEWDETLAEGCSREIKEETNLFVPSEKLKLWTINDDPKDAHQNVTVRFMSFSKSYSEQTLHSENSEPDEVEDIKWISLDELGNYEWAFNHLKLIIECVFAYFTIYFSSLSNGTKLYLKSLEYDN